MTEQELYQLEYWLERGFAGDTVSLDVTTNEAGDTQSTEMDSTFIEVGMTITSTDFASGTTVTAIDNPGSSAIVHFSTGKLTGGTTVGVLFTCTGILTGTCPKIYKSREPLDLESPRVEIKAIIGNAMSDHAKGFADGSEAYDAFDGSLEITVVTNRSTTAGTLTHDQLLGAVRSRLTMRYLKAINNATQLSNWQSPAVAPADLRAQGTVDSFFDGDCIDTTVLSYYLVFSVKQTAWPDL